MCEDEPDFSRRTILAAHSDSKAVLKSAKMKAGKKRKLGKVYRVSLARQKGLTSLDYFAIMIEH